MKDAKAIRVLLVDDHPVVRAGYRRMLELEDDFDVVGEAGDVDDALRALSVEPARQPNIVVVDLAMPRRSGMELVREVKQRASTTRVLVFSMHDSPAVVGEALRLGAAGFVTKASAPEELIRCLRLVMTQSAPVVSTDLAARRVLQADDDKDPLSAKEIEVLKLLATGDPLALIGEKLQLSSKTISNYQTSLKHKLGASNAIELLRCARERGLIV